MQLTVCTLFSDYCEIVRVQLIEVKPPEQPKSAKKTPKRSNK